MYWFLVKKCLKNLRNTIPVVASTFVLNDSAYAAPEGIIKLIDVFRGDSRVSDS